MEVSMTPDGIQATMYIARQIVDKLSKQFKFDETDALNYLELMIKRSSCCNEEVENKQRKTNIPLPFCGVINANCCYGVRLNYGLYTQCNNNQTCYNNTHPVCETCNKQINKNANNQPTYGYITTRLENGNNFRDPKGKSPVNYANIMEKLNISQIDAEKAAKELGLKIPEDQFILKKIARGRPRKDTSADDTASEASYSSVKEEKKRGRPRKNKEVVDKETTDNNIINDMMKTIHSEVNKNTPKPVNQELNCKDCDCDCDESDDETEAFPIKLKKKSDLGYVNVETVDEADYLLTADNKLYDPKTHDLKGVWNSKTRQIDDFESDDDY